MSSFAKSSEASAKRDNIKQSLRKCEDIPFPQCLSPMAWQVLSRTTAAIGVPPSYIVGHIMAHALSLTNHAEIFTVRDWKESGILFMVTSAKTGTDQFTWQPLMYYLNRL